MSRLETLIERARSLPPDEQDALADEMQTWLDMPSPPDDFGADGSDAELERRVKAWRDSPTGIAAADLHADERDTLDNIDLSLPPAQAFNPSSTRLRTGAA